METTENGYTSSAVYTVCDMPIVPMHYYSAVADSYDYEGSSFGVVYGDLDATFNAAALSQPMGAGAYSYSGYADGVLTLTAEVKDLLEGLGHCLNRRADGADV